MAYKDKKIVTYLSPEVHRMLRVKAALSGMTIAQVADQVIARALASEDKEPGAADAE